MAHSSKATATVFIYEIAKENEKGKEKKRTNSPPSPTTRESRKPRRGRHGQEQAT
jgi:hypothetical protein